MSKADQEQDAQFRAYIAQGNELAALKAKLAEQEKTIAALREELAEVEKEAARCLSAWKAKQEKTIAALVEAATWAIEAIKDSDQDINGPLSALKSAVDATRVKGEGT